MAEVETVTVVAMGVRAGIRCHTRTGPWIPYANHYHESTGHIQFRIEEPCYRHKLKALLWNPPRPWYRHQEKPSLVSCKGGRR
jgi:hypothetical protein